MPRSALLALLMCLSLTAQAGQSPAAVALASVLGEAYLEIVHAEALPDGVVEILFGLSVADHEVTRVVDWLRAQEGVRDVIARTTPRTF